jgi:hypothetical protein
VHSPADDLGERREDRVLEFGQDQADQPGALPAQLGGALVAEHVERGRDGRAGGVGHAGLAVQHPAHRRLADPGLLRDIRKSSWHGARILQISARNFANGRDGCSGSIPFVRTVEIRIV